MTTMADLTDGTRIHHPGWNLDGVIRQLGYITEIRFSGVFGEIEISDSGPVFPADVEITGRAS